jgi:very-short-patch-repair endonuclease
MKTMLCYDPKLKQRSRKLRNNSTLAAVLVWNPLKQNAGLPVLKTKIYKHIVGFYCPKLKLVIESEREKF